MPDLIPNKKLIATVGIIMEPFPILFYRCFERSYLSRCLEDCSCKNHYIKKDLQIYVTVIVLIDDFRK